MSGPLDWAEPGALCAIVHQIGYTGDRAPIIKNTRVLRVTKTQVVLLTDDRFNRRTGARIGERRDAWGSSRMSLYAEGSPELAEARLKAERIRLSRLAKHLADAGIALMDVRAVALYVIATAADADLLERAERLTRMVGGIEAPTLTEAAEIERSWIKEKQR